MPRGKMNSPRILALFTSLFCSTLVQAQDGTDTSKNYLFTQLNYASLDSERRVDGSGLGATFGFGHNLNAIWAYEVRLAGLVLERGDESGTDFYQQDIGVDGIYRFAPFGGWQPFALAGLSIIRNDVDLDDLDDVSAGAHIGVGLASSAIGNTNLRWRIDLRYVHDDYLEGRQDIRLGVGIEIPLGGRASGGYVSSRGRTADDSDKDGVADHTDRCPGSLPGLEVDADGCMKPEQSYRLVDVEFDNGTSILTTASRHELGKVVRALRGQPDMRVEIVGHTDSVGNAQLNQRLSRERAEAVATYLVLQGVPTQRLTVEGYGESLPIANNNTAEGRRKNRRIELNLLKPAGQ